MDLQVSVNILHRRTYYSLFCVSLLGRKSIFSVEMLLYMLTVCSRLRIETPSGSLKSQSRMRNWFLLQCSAHVFRNWALHLRQFSERRSLCCIWCVHNSYCSCFDLLIRDSSKDVQTLRSCAKLCRSGGILASYFFPLPEHTTLTYLSLFFTVPAHKHSSAFCRRVRQTTVWTFAASDPRGGSCRWK